ncbi:MAG: ABC transporter permease, partial [Actinomycetota bacterium]|nr:ABC transporter permease [Actinomycetota bacterium]
MGRVIVRGFLARKLRSALTAIAIFLGVAMISGTFVLTDKINAAFTDIFREGNENVDVVVWKETTFGSDPTTGSGVPFDAAVVDEVERAAGVRLAAPVLQTSGFLVRGTEKLVAQGGAPSILASVVPSELSADRVVEGSMPDRSGEVAVIEQLADDEELSVGDRLQLSTTTGLHPVTVSAVYRFGDVSSVGGATVVLAPLEDVQLWSNLEGQATRIDVAGSGGVSEDALATRVRGAVPSDLVVETGTENAERQAGDVAENLSFLNYLLLAFGFVAVFVGAFIIFNTYSITVAQRTREFGLLRTLGATARQTLLAVLGEALIVGAIATVLGILGGIVFAALLTALFDALGFGIPSVGTVIKPRTIIWAVAVGLGVTLIASLFPGLRAMAVSPLAALRGAMTARRPRRWLRLTLTAIALVLAVVLLGYGTAAGGPLAARLITLAIGAILFLLAVALSMPYLVRPLVAVLEKLARRVGGGEGRLAARNTSRNPGRTAVTAAALMIGTGLVVFVAILGSGLKQSITDALGTTLQADLIVRAETSGSPLPAQVPDRVREVDGVEAVSPIGFAHVQVDGERETQLLGVDPGTLGDVYNFDWTSETEPAPADLENDGAFVEKGVADAGGLAVGSTIEVKNQSGATGRFEVKGIYEDPSILPGVLVSEEALRPLRPPGDTGVSSVLVATGGDKAAIQQRVEQILRPFPIAEVSSNVEVKEEAEGDINQLLAIFYALLAMSVIISLFGIVNTLVLSVYERTREIGVLRAVGTTPRQVRRMIRYESVMTALLGAVLGVVVGIVFGFAVTTALADEGLGFSLPLGQIIVFMILAVVAGIVAAILPAR